MTPRSGQHDPFLDPVTAGRSDPAQSRLNLLLSYGPDRDEEVMDQLPRLLAPMGIRSIRATTGERAARAVADQVIHIAVVDIAVPLCDESDRRAAGAGVLVRRRGLALPPPRFVVRPPRPTVRDSARELSEALRAGAFTVLDRPLGLEALLEVLRRILRRHYADLWPGPPTRH
jgi:DNA-binding response OmpR family regulator